MKKPRFKGLKTFRKKVQVPSKKSKRSHSHDPRGMHLDGSPCSGYCSCMQKEGFGMTTLIYNKSEQLFGDYEDFLWTIQFLVNSKWFMEFLCTCRYYIYAYNLSKKSYFTLVLCSTLRDIAMASIHMQSSYNITRFLNYCFKWIRELKREKITCDEFLRSYMRGIHSEVNVSNTFLFKQWSGQVLFHNSISPLMNPLQCIVQKKEEGVFTTRGVYSLKLPMEVAQRSWNSLSGAFPLFGSVESVLSASSVLSVLSVLTAPSVLSALSALSTFPLSFPTPSTFPTQTNQYPTLSITATSLQQHNQMIRWSNVLLLICEHSTTCQLPPILTLPQNRGEKVACYSIRSVGCRENNQRVLYKRLFPSKFHHPLKKRIYDVHTSGKWVRIQGQNVTEIAWSQVQFVAPEWIHYERDLHSSMLSF